jgi:peptidoglycan/LPS O-acetylase OafA/YrhL
MTSQPSRSTHSETLSLTGLRGLAALCVLVEHYSVWCAPYDRMMAPGWLIRALGNSAWGMSLFFTLSGFVIAYNYLAMDWGNRAAASAARFAWLRFSRLYPVLLVYLALTYVRPSSYGDETLTAQALLMVSVESLYPFKLNGHWLTDPLCWSISTEIALYAIFVLCVVAFRKAKRRFGGAAIGIAAGLAVLYLTAIAWLTWHQATMYPALAALPSAFDPISPEEGARWFFYWSPYVRFYDFAFGWMAAIAVLRGFRLPPWLDGGILPLCCAILWLAWVSGAFGFREDILQPLLPPLFAMVMAARPASRISRALSVPWLLFFWRDILFALFVPSVCHQPRGPRARPSILLVGICGFLRHLRARFCDCRRPCGWPVPGG